MPDLDFTKLPSQRGVTPRVTSGFDAPRDGGKRKHRALDYEFGEGEPVAVNKGGVVKKIGEDGRSGKHLFIDHGDGDVSSYSHLSGFDVKEGDEVKPGQVFARAGSTGTGTGPHVHQVVRRKGQRINPQESGILPVRPVEMLKVPTLDFSSLPSQQAEPEYTRRRTVAEPPPPKEPGPLSADLIPQQLVEQGPGYMPQGILPGEKRPEPQRQPQYIRRRPQRRPAARIATTEEIKDALRRAQPSVADIKREEEQRFQPSRNRVRDVAAPEPYTFRRSRPTLTPAQESRATLRDPGAPTGTPEEIHRQEYAKAAEEYAPIAAVPFVDKAKTAVGSLARGVAEIPAGLLDTIGTLAYEIDKRAFNSQKQRADYFTVEAAKRIREGVAGRTTQDKRLVGTFLYDTLPQAAGSALGFAGPGWVTKSKYVVPAFLGVTAGFSEGYNDAKKAGASDDDALKSALLNGGMGASEILPVSTWVGRMNRATKGTFGRLLKTAGKETTEEAIQVALARPGMREVGKTVAREMLEEGGQEAAQTAFGNFVANTIVGYDPNRKTSQGVLESAAAGGLVGGGMSATTQGVERLAAPVPESPQTLRSQFQSALNPNSPRAAVLVTEGEKVQRVPKGFHEVETEQGRLYLNAEKANGLGLDSAEAIESYLAENGVEPLIGKVAPVEDTSTGVALRTEDAKGQELSTSIVPTEEAAVAQAEVDKAQFPEAANQELMPAQEAVERRVDETPDVARDEELPRISVDAAPALPPAETGPPQVREVGAEGQRIASSLRGEVASVPESQGESVRAELQEAPPATVVAHSDPRIDGGEVVGRTGDGRLKVRNNEGGTSVVKDPRRQGNREATIRRGLVVVPKEVKVETPDSGRVQEAEVKEGENVPQRLAEISSPSDTRSADQMERPRSPGATPADIGRAGEEVRTETPPPPAVAQPRDVPVRREAMDVDISSRDVGRLSNIVDASKRRAGLDTTTAKEPHEMTYRELREAVSSRSPAPDERGVMRVAPSERELVRKIWPEYTERDKPLYGNDYAVGIWEQSRGDAYARLPLEDLSKRHRAAITKAVNEGKPVPPEVLADYPDLAGSAAPPQGAETAKPEMTRERSLPKSAEAAGLEGGRERFYEVKTNVESEKRAREAIQAKGVDGAISWVMAEDAPSAEHSATALELIKGLSREAKEETNTDVAAAKLAQAVDVASAMAVKATEAGQAIQYLSTLAKESPEGAVLYAQRVIKKRDPNAKLTTEQAKALMEAAERISKLEGEVESLASQIEEAKLRAPAKPRPKLETLQDRLSKLEADARARLEARKQAGVKGGQTGASPIPLDIADYVVIYAAKLARKTVDAAILTDEMVREFGEEIRPYLDEIRRASVALHRAQQKALTEEQLIARVTDGKPEDFTPEQVRELVQAEREKVSQKAKDRAALRSEYLKTLGSIQGPKVSEARKSGQPLQGPKMSEAKKLPAEGPRLSDARRSGMPLQGPKLTEAPRLGPKLSEGMKSGPPTPSDVMRAIVEGAEGDSALMLGASKYVRPEMSREVWRREMIEGHGVSSQEASVLEGRALKLYRDAVRGVREKAAERAATEGRQVGPDELARLVRERERASKERAKARRELMLALKRFEEGGPSTAQRLNNLFRGIVVSAMQTAVRNIQSQVVRTGIEGVTDAAEAAMNKALRKAGIPVAEDSLPEGVGVLDAIQPFTYLTQRNKRVAEGILDEFPAEYEEMFGSLSAGYELTSSKGASGLADRVLQKAEKTVEALNFLNRWQEFLTRRSVFLGTLDARMKAKGVDVFKLADEGKAKEIPREDIQAAVRKSLEVTFATSPKRGTLAGEAVYRFSNSLPAPINPLTFARFMYNSAKFVAEYQPTTAIRGLYRTAKNRKVETRDFAKAAVGSVFLLTASQILNAFGGDDDEWYTLRIPGTDRLIDARPYQPFAAYLFLAHSAQRLGEGKNAVKGGTAGEKLAQLGEGLVGLSQFENPAWEAVKAFTTGDEEKTITNAQKQAGNTVGALFTPLKTAKDIIGAFDKEERIVRDYSDEPFMGGVKRNIPFASRNSKARTDATGEPLEVPLPALKPLAGLRVLRPDEVRPKQTAAEELANDIRRRSFPDKERSKEEKEASRLVAQLKNAVRKGANVEGRIKALVKDGKLSAKQADNILDVSALTPLQEDIKAMSLEDARKVINRMTPAEVESVKDIMRAKMLREAEKEEKEQERIENPEKAERAARKSEKAQRKRVRKLERKYGEAVDAQE